MFAGDTGCRAVASKDQIFQGQSEATLLFSKTKDRIPQFCLKTKLLLAFQRDAVGRLVVKCRFVHGLEVKAKPRAGEDYLRASLGGSF